MHRKKEYNVLGLMSGTSCDGIDISYLITDGEMIRNPRLSLFFPYPELFQKRLKLLTFRSFQDRDILDGLSEELIFHHIQSIKNFIQTHKVKIDLIGFHGQTIFHKPCSSKRPAITFQIGDSQKLANCLGIPVVGNFRYNDVRKGGEGAPFVPLYHKILVESLGLLKDNTKPICLLNIGGVANVTLLGGSYGLLSGDLGPGCALINDWISFRTDQLYDKDGAIAKRGNIHNNLIEQWMKNAFFTLPLPKSIDRNKFSFILNNCQDLSLNDGAATLSEFTARSIIQGLPHDIQKVILCGGGRKNPFLKKRLSLYFDVSLIDSYSGFDGDFIESEAFAFLAVCSLLCRPLSYPSTTKVSHITSGGDVFWPHLHDKYEK